MRVFLFVTAFLFFGSVAGFYNWIFFLEWGIHPCTPAFEPWNAVIACASHALLHISDILPKEEKSVCAGAHSGISLPFLLHMFYVATM